AFVVITLLGIRRWLADSISPSMKHSFAVGIGLFLAFIGLYQTGIVTSPLEGMSASSGVLPKPAVPVKLGDLRDPRVILAILGLLITMILMCRGVRSAILLGMVLTGVAGYALGVAEKPAGIMALPFVGEYDLSPVALQLDITGLLHWSMLPVLLTLFLMSFL